MRRTAVGLTQFWKTEEWWLSHLVVFAVAFIFFLTLQASPVFADPDSFYHAKMALLIRDQGIIHSFPWLDLTILGERFTDQHFLYHVALIPFVTWLPPLIGIKLATVFFGAALTTILYWVMRQWRVPWPMVFVVLFLLVRPGIFRLSLAKAPSTSLIFLVVGLSWIFAYHFRRLFWLAFIYVWYYGGFALLGVAAAIYSGVSVWHDRFISHLNARRFIQKIFALVSRRSRHERNYHFNLRLLLVVVAGLAAGIIFNPYFPNNLDFYFHQVINIGIINFQRVIGVGGEWYPYNFGELVANTVFISLLIILSAFGILFRFRAQSKQTWTLALLTIFFFFLTLKSRRYVEYYVPVALLFSAFSLRDTLGGHGGRMILAEIRHLWHDSWPARWAAGAMVGLVLLAVGYIGGRDMYNEYRDLRNGFSANLYQRASLWLTLHTPAGSRVVHSDWDEFPVLFYHNTHNTYIVGLDPTFFYKANERLYWIWVDITLGKYSGDLATAVTKDLGSQFVFIDNDHGAMRQLVERNGSFTLRYADDEARIYSPVAKTAAAPSPSQP